MGTPDDNSTMDMNLIDYEIDSIRAVCTGDKEKATSTAGGAAQRINDMPKVADMIQGIVKETEDILKNVQTKFLD